MRNKIALWLLAGVLAGIMGACNSLEHDQLLTQRETAKSAAQVAEAGSRAEIAGSNAMVAQADANVSMYQTLADAAGQTGRLLGGILFGLFVITVIVLWFVGKYYFFKMQTAAQEREIQLITARDRAAADLYYTQQFAGLPGPQLAPRPRIVVSPGPALTDGPKVPPAVAARARQTPGAQAIWHPDRGWLIVDAASGKVLVSCRKVIA